MSFDGDLDLCPGCNHPVYFHRANTVDQLRGLDDPVPCFAAIGVLPHDSASHVEYAYCGCRTNVP